MFTHISLGGIGRYPSFRSNLLISYMYIDFEILKMRVRVCNQAKARYKYSWRRNYICAPSCAPDQIINQKNTTVQDKEKTRADEILVPKANKSMTTCMHHYSCSLTTLFSPTRVCALNSTLLFLSYTLDQPRIYLPTSQDLFAILSFSSRS